MFTHAEAAALQERLRQVSLPLLLTSAALVVPVILTNLCVAWRRRTPSIWSTIFLLGSLSLSATLAATALPGGPAWIAQSPTICFAQGLAVQVSVIVMCLGWLMCAYSLHQIVVKHVPMETLRQRRLRHLSVCFVCLCILTGVPVYLSSPRPYSAGLFCWLNEKQGFGLTFASFYLEMFVILCTGGYYVCAVLRRLRQHALAGSPADQQTLNDYTKRHILFLACFAVVHVCTVQDLVVSRVDARHARVAVGGNSTHVPGNAVSEYIFVVAYSTIGIMGFIVFGTAGSILKQWKSVLLCRACGREADGTGTSTNGGRGSSLRLSPSSVGRGERADSYVDCAATTRSISDSSYFERTFHDGGIISPLLSDDELQLSLPLTAEGRVMVV